MDIDILTRSLKIGDSSTLSMDAHALNCPDTLRLIFEKLPVPDLARASCVCRIWNAVASDSEIVKAAFIRPWKLKDVVGEPVSDAFWRDNSVGKFAISHKIVAGDTVARLAVKYSVQVMDIRRLNNMMSDHGIYSRERLLIPISEPEILANGICYIELDTHAKREVAENQHKSLYELQFEHQTPYRSSCCCFGMFSSSPCFDENRILLAKSI